MHRCIFDSPSAAQLQRAPLLAPRLHGRTCMPYMLLRSSTQSVRQSDRAQSNLHRAQIACCAQAAAVEQFSPSSPQETEIAPGVFEGVLGLVEITAYIYQLQHRTICVYNAAAHSTGFWTWRGFRIRYQRCGMSGPPALMVHGFGGNW